MTRKGKVGSTRNGIDGLAFCVSLKRQGNGVVVVVQELQHGEADPSALCPAY